MAYYSLYLGLIMNKILDSNKLIRDVVKCPTIEDLIKAERNNLYNFK